MQINDSVINVEVVYGLPDNQVLKLLRVPNNATVEQVIHLSGLLQQFAEIDLTNNPLGIHSRRVTLKDRVVDGDRVEIYRSLLLDPKQARKARIKRQAEKV